VVLAFEQPPSVHVARTSVEQLNRHKRHIYGGMIASRSSQAAMKWIVSEDLPIIIVRRYRLTRSIVAITDVVMHAIIIRVVGVWVCNQVFEENKLVRPNQDQIPLNVYP
jgi:hypothetical protein